MNASFFSKKWECEPAICIQLSGNPVADSRHPVMEMAEEILVGEKQLRKSFAVHCSLAWPEDVN